MFRPEIRAKIDQELENAGQARRLGMEGRARVCARRAAGVAIRAYMSAHDLALPGPSAMDALEAFRLLPGLSAEHRRAADHLLTRVDEGFLLPENIDLLAEVRQLVNSLEHDTGEADQ